MNEETNANIATVREQLAQAIALRGDLRQRLAAVDVIRDNALSMIDAADVFASKIKANSIAAGGAYGEWSRSKVAEAEAGLAGVRATLIRLDEIRAKLADDLPGVVSAVEALVLLVIELATADRPPVNPAAWQAAAAALRDDAYARLPMRRN